MPVFVAELELPRSFSSRQTELFGRLYRLRLRPVAQNRANDQAYFYPEVGSQTIVGATIARALRLDTLGPTDLVKFTLQNMSRKNTGRLDIYIERQDIREAESAMPADWIQLSFDVLEKHLNVDDCAPLKKSRTVDLIEDRTKARCYA